MLLPFLLRIQVLNNKTHFYSAVVSYEYRGADNSLRYYAETSPGEQKRLPSVS